MRGTVKYVPLLEMTEEDWRILDFDDLRAKAKNRLCFQIVAGTLVGFFHVNLMEKARTKKDYFWPANEESLRRFIEDDEVPFQNETDDEFEDGNSDAVQSKIDEIDSLVVLGGIGPTNTSTPHYVNTLSLIIAAALKKKTNDQIEQEATVLRNKIVNLTPEYSYLLLTIWLYRHFTEEKIVAILEEIET